MIEASLLFLLINTETNTIDRKDLTYLKVYAIDVDEDDEIWCFLELDDALSATRIQDVWFKVWIHVANPSSLVQPWSRIDRYNLDTIGLFNQTVISVGSSGAVFGLLWAMLSELMTNWSIYANKCLDFYLALCFLFVPSLSGLPRDTESGDASAPVRSKFKSYQCVLWTISLILLIVGPFTAVAIEKGALVSNFDKYAVGLIMLFKGVNGNDHCSWCHYLHCIPTKRWSCKQPAPRR
ncbi:Ribonuclease II/R, partial [Dillenia turbinata]